MEISEFDIESALPASDILHHSFMNDPSFEY